jgi:hypothetical protein
VDVDGLAVGLLDLDLVGAFLVADLGLGDAAAAGALERRRLGLVERRAGDRLLVLALAAGRAGERRSPDGERRDGGACDQDSLQRCTCPRIRRVTRAVSPATP